MHAVPHKHNQHILDDFNRAYADAMDIFPRLGREEQTKVLQAGFGAILQVAYGAMTDWPNEPNPLINKLRSEGQEIPEGTPERVDISPERLEILTATAYKLIREAESG